MGMSKGVSDALTSETPFSLAAYTDLFQKIISLHAARGFRLCGGEQRALRSPFAILRVASF